MKSVLWAPEIHPREAKKADCRIRYSPGRVRPRPGPTAAVALLAPFAPPSRCALAKVQGNLAHRGTHLWTWRGACDFRGMRIALYQPDIAQNTGTILRLAACLGISVDIIGPAGFDMTDRTLRRAGLDYLDHVSLTRHESFATFLAGRTPSSGRLVLLSSHSELPYSDFAFQASDVLLLGRESAGAPVAVHDTADARIRIPMRDGLRSLNIAVAAAMVVGEALRQTNGFPGSRAILAE